nr:PREDICTED: E3 ubiquitin-protein ligase RNF149 isoform X2 [Latimeria chalumnae]|eukprot:XP_014348134.1 PREDICTED: E3 ubiquitin-protein ligase RNF149 isoform X2 [Latimeria chalumnae]
MRAGSASPVLGGCWPSPSWSSPSLSSSCSSSSSSSSPRRSWGTLCLLYLLHCQLQPFSCKSMEWFTAFVSTSYLDPATNLTVTESQECGRYGDSSPKESVQGAVGIPSSPRDLEGCDPDVEYSVPSGAGLPLARDQPWIALVARGSCTFKDKVLNAAGKMASAVVIYNEARFGNATVPMSHIGTGNTIVVMVGNPKGMEILDLVRRGFPVRMSIAVGTRHVQEFITGQSVVFVIIAFITMMIISLAWLIFYYIQRFLYTGSQFGNQNSRRETKKAIGKLQLHTIKRDDKEIDLDSENCAVCIENYKPKDVVRILPCNCQVNKITGFVWCLKKPGKSWNFTNKNQGPGKVLEIFNVIKSHGKRPPGLTSGRQDVWLTVGNDVS